jgi:phosphonate transport system substrate-binding protein
MRTSISLLFTLTLYFICFFSQAFADEQGVKKIFTLGVISTKPQKRIKETMPLVDYIVNTLPEYNERKVLVSESVEDMSRLLNSGEVTMLVATPYAALLIERKTNAKIEALRWKQGVESYHSVIFSRNDSNINEVKDLLGRTITFEKDSSTSAFFAPAVYLLKQGFELQKMHSIKDKPAADKVGYLFINDHLRQSNEVNMAIWIFHKRLDVASFSNLDWQEPNPPPLKRKKNCILLLKQHRYREVLSYYLPH